jgi:hypothetical protein
MTQPAKRKARAPEPEPSNALVSSQGNWTFIKPTCHPDQPWALHHSTTHGIYTLVCAGCERIFLRIDVGRSR